MSKVKRVTGASRRLGMAGAAAPVLIGITTQQRDPVSRRFALRFSYVDAVRAAGGVPLLLPPGEPDVAPLLARLDGLLLSGGGDIDPARYHQSHHRSMYLIDRERDEFELALAQHALQCGLPLLGICRGAQVLAVASGGDLVPHIPDRYGAQVAHRDEDLDVFAQVLPFSYHAVTVEAGSRLAGAVGVRQLEVPSMHHQAIARLPAGWRVTARASDGVIEAIERNGAAWQLAVQWHPEVATPTSPHHGLFRALVAAACAYRQPAPLPAC